MTADEFVAAVKKIIDDHKVKDDEASSALAGMVVANCTKHGEDPHDYIQWAIDSTKYTHTPLKIIILSKEAFEEFSTKLTDLGYPPTLLEHVATVGAALELDGIAIQRSQQ